MKYVSLDNGNTYLTAAETMEALADEECCIDWEALANAMDDVVREAVAAELAPCTELEFLTRYLELSSDDLVIG